MSRTDALIRDIEVMVSDLTSPQAKSRRLAEFARAEIGKALATNRSALGRDTPYDVIVDGRPGAALESVRPDGVIVANFELAADTLEWIGDALLKASPRRTGRYEASHVLFVDGVPHEPGAPVADFEEAIFVNLQPYARKIERGLSAQAPDGVYQAVAAVAKRRFGNIAAIRFSYRSIQQGGVVAYKAAGARGTVVRGDKGRFAGSRSTRSAETIAAANTERETRQPAIVVRVR